jgi:nitrate reductase gamma subunit
MKIVWPLVAVGALAFLADLGAGEPGLKPIFGIVIPYAAVAILVIGIVVRVLTWARSPVPFRIPTTCGQQRSLPWIKSSRLDNPSSGAGALARVALEVLLFRSLFRNTRTEVKKDGRVVHSASRYLWAGALAFHASLLVILLRHCRFFMQPVPRFVQLLQSVDGFLQIGVPVVYVTDMVLIASLAYLLFRRLYDPRLRYISLFGDYFPVFLIMTIAASGILTRHFLKADTVGVKDLAMGLVTFHPRVVAGLRPFFFVHLFLVCVLGAYLPFSKLIHMAGIFVSPTRNLANDNRRTRHLNPWNPPIVGHTYADWEAEFEDKLHAAGIPLDRE